MDALDGNAIAGALFELFGQEMTLAEGVCAGCGSRCTFAETLVYVGGPGTVMRCNGCSAILAVFVTVRGLTCVDLRGFASITT